MAQPLIMAVVLVLSMSLLVPTALVSAILAAMFHAFNIVVQYVAPAGPPQHMLRNAAAGYLSPLALRDFNGATWALVGVLVLLVVGVSLVDARLMRWNQQLADMAKVSVPMVEHYNGASYDKAQILIGTASAVRRPKL